jgi:hypothetical protein
MGCINFLDFFCISGWGMLPQVEKEKAAYQAALKQGPTIEAKEEADLGMQVVLVDGDEVIADSQSAGSLLAACDQFRSWVQRKFPKSEQ